MGNNEINIQDDAYPEQIILKYLEGEELGKTKGNLESLMLKTKISCTANYQGITKNRLEVFKTQILNTLSIGGCELHILSLETAQQKKYSNCYIWDKNKSILIYLHAGNNVEILTLIDVTVFEHAINHLTNKTAQSTIHLFANQVDELITKNTVNQHVPPTSDLKQIQDYKKSPNLYTLLKKLAVKHRHLVDLIALIDEVKPAQNWGFYFIFAAGITAATSMLFHLKENIAIFKTWFETAWPILSRWFGSTVELLRKTPLMGIVFNIIPLVNAWFQAFSDEAGIDQNKFIKLLLKTLSHLLPIAGFILCYLAGATMTLPALALFVTGAIVDVVDSLYTVAMDEYYRWTNPLASGTEYYSRAAKARADNLYERGLLMFLINFTASVLMTASIIIWCMFPPSLMIALPCVIFGWCVGSAKHSLLAYTQKEYANALQSDLDYIYKDSKPHQEKLSQIELLNQAQQLMETINGAVKTFQVICQQLNVPEDLPPVSLSTPLKPVVNYHLETNVSTLSRGLSMFTRKASTSLSTNSSDSEEEGSLNTVVTIRKRHNTECDSVDLDDAPLTTQMSISK